MAFKKTVADALARLPVDLLAYCIMPNHWHLVLRPRKDGELSAFMQWLTLAHVQRWRTSHNTIGYGPLYQGRFKSFPVECDEYLLVVLRYVERNALRANLVAKAEAWKWSSLYQRLSRDSEEKVALCEWPVDRPADWTEFVNTPQTTAEEEAIRASIYKSRPYGAARWQRQVAAELGLSSCFRKSGRPKHA